MVKGTLWVAAVPPVILSIGAFLASINIDVLNTALPYINKQSKSTDDDADNVQKGYFEEAMKGEEKDRDTPEKEFNKS